MSAENLFTYVGAHAQQEAFVDSCWAEASALVDDYVGEVQVPTVILDRAKLEVGSALFHRRQAPNGIAQFATADGNNAVRVARDPMVAAYPLLERYTGLGVG
jgi:hypothetical protein